jgi:hypothetical protein
VSGSVTKSAKYNVPRKFVAVENPTWSELFLDSLGLPHGLDGSSLLIAFADSDIVHVDGLGWVVDHIIRVE